MKSSNWKNWLWTPLLLEARIGLKALPAPPIGIGFPLSKVFQRRFYATSYTQTQVNRSSVFQGFLLGRSWQSWHVSGGGATTFPFGSSHLKAQGSLLYALGFHSKSFKSVLMGRRGAPSVLSFQYRNQKFLPGGLFSFRWGVQGCLMKEAPASSWKDLSLSGVGGLRLAFQGFSIDVMGFKKEGRLGFESLQLQIDSFSEHLSSEESLKCVQRLFQESLNQAPEAKGTQDRGSPALTGGPYLKLSEALEAEAQPQVVEPGKKVILQTTPLLASIFFKKRAAAPKLTLQAQPQIAGLTQADIDRMISLVDNVLPKAGDLQGIKTKRKNLNESDIALKPPVHNDLTLEAEPCGTEVSHFEAPFQALSEALSPKRLEALRTESTTDSAWSNDNEASFEPMAEENSSAHTFQNPNRYQALDKGCIGMNHARIFSAIRNGGLAKAPSASGVQRGNVGSFYRGEQQAQPRRGRLIRFSKWGGPRQNGTPKGRHVNWAGTFP